MSPDQDVLDTLKRELPFLKEHFAVKRIAVFGSASRGTMNTDSDVDLVIDFDTTPGLKFIALCEYIEKTLGRKTDILTPNGLDSIRVKSVADRIRKDFVYV
ncbi:MAG: nucleotidyltransferase domain-containing protein [Planctomycetota bacterium]